MRAPTTVLVTGATGLIGFDVLWRWLTATPADRAFVLIRDPAKWAAARSLLGHLGDRVTPLLGDVRRPGLGLATEERARLAATVTHAVHSAADLAFTRPLAEARATNTEGTRHLLELAAEWPRLERLVQVSTLNVAGRRQGLVLEQDNGSAAGWVNGYEQSKYEAEGLVRESGLPWVIARSGLVICNRPGGEVQQLNAAHHSFRLWRDGLVPMLPGSDATTVDVVSRDAVGGGIAALLRHPGATGATVHLGTGSRALKLPDVLALAWDVWRSDPGWRRRAIPLPALVSLDTYRLFEETILDTAEPRLRRIVRSLASFTPALAYPKCFDVRCAEALVGAPVVTPAALWRTAFEYTARNGAATRAAA